MDDEREVLDGEIVEEPYVPAERPPGMPGGDRIRFEREGGFEQSMFGGGAQDIARSIMDDTQVNMRILNKKIERVRTVKGDLGAGQMMEIVFMLSDGVELHIRAQSGLHMAVVERG